MPCDRSAPAIFPSVRSLLSPSALAQMVGITYGLTQARCRLIKATSRDVYHVDSHDGPHVLIMYRHGRRTASEIEAELDLLDYLDTRGLAVAPAVPTLTGERLVALSASEGTRYAVLFRFVKGSLLSHGLSDDVARRFGRLVAHMHIVADGWEESPRRGVRPPLDASLLIDGSMTHIEPLVCHLPDTLTELRQMAAALHRHLERLPCEAPGYGWVHGDIIPTNVMVGPDDELTLLDFDFCGVGWRIFDVATYLWASRAQQTAETATRAFLAGYGDVRPLADWELGALPLFMAVRGLFRLGNWGPRVDEWGTSTLPDDLIERQVVAIRDDLSRC